MGGAKRVGTRGRNCCVKMQAAVNENRLQSALSKLGRVDPADRVACRRLFEAVCADVEESLCDDGLLTTPSELAEGYASVHHALVRLARHLVTGHLRRASAPSIADGR